MNNQMPAIYTDTVMQLRRITEGFMQTGFADITESNSDDTYLLHTPMVSKYMRKVAKELKRPPLMVRRYYSTVHLVVPKRKYLMPIVSGLIIAADEKNIGHWSSATLWEFRFYKLEMFEEWRKNILAIPECRQALKLPPLLQEVTSHAA